MKFFDVDLIYWIIGLVALLFHLLIFLYIFISGFNSKREKERVAEEDVIEMLASSARSGTGKVRKRDLLDFISSKTGWSTKDSEMFIKISLIPRNVIVEIIENGESFFTPPYTQND